MKGVFDPEGPPPAPDRDEKQFAAQAISRATLDLDTANLRNYQAHPVWGFMADQIWLR